MTQTQRVLSRLADTPNEWVDAMEFITEEPPILRYAARINELRNEGFEIETKRKEGRTWAQYKLTNFNQNQHG